MQGIRVGLVLGLHVLSALPAATLLQNGDFEKGLAGWSTHHPWFERPKGAGLSRITAAKGEGRNGSTALKIVGDNNRGIAMQVLPGYPGKYRVSGWIRAEGLGNAEAGVLLEWMDRKGKWMRGDSAVRVRGDCPWKRFETVVEAPRGTRSIHFDLLTLAPNRGTVWFDDIRIERLKQGLPPPSPPRITAAAPDGDEGSLKVAWSEKNLSPGCIRLIVYCADSREQFKAASALPSAVFDAADEHGMIRSLKNDTTYYLAARAVNGDGLASDIGPVVSARPVDRQPPRPGWIQAFAADRTSGVRISWRPHVLDHDVQRVHFLAATRDGQVRELRTVESAAWSGTERPFYCTAPWIEFETVLNGQEERVGVRCEDRAGNESETTWTHIVPPAAAGPAPCELRILPPTAQVRRDAPLPPESHAPRGLQPLRVMPGQAKGFQVLLRPHRDLHEVRVAFRPLRAVQGDAVIPPRWLAYHFVNYIRLEKNSRATPPSELVWRAPAEYPDELDDAPLRDLAADQNQPVFIRITAPRGTPSGEYRGKAEIVCREGRLAFGIWVRVEPIALPERTRLKFVYWFSWADACKEFGVERFAEDGWRVLARLGELMRAHHQNVVRVPWQLIRTWRRADGGLEHDFRDFDRFIRTFQRAAVDAMFCLHHVGGRATSAWKCPVMKSRAHRVVDMTTGAEERVDVLDILPAVQEHIARLGLLERFAVHVADEPIPENLASYRRLSAAVHERAPALRRIDAVHVPDLEGALEIWVPQLNYFEQWLDKYRAARKSGNEIWFYVAWVPQGKYPNRMIDSHAVKPRILHWLNALYDTSGYLHWALNHWHISLMSLQSPGDQYICWPSQRFIADSSLRYEAEREGLEDCEMLFMLRDALVRGGRSRRGAEERIRRLAGDAVTDFQHYTREWDVLEATRNRLLDLLEETVAGTRK